MAYGSHEFHNGLNELADAAENFGKTMRDNLDLIREIEPTLKPKEIKMYVNWNREFTKYMKTLNIIMSSFTDDRYSYSLPRWFQIYYDIKEYGYSYAADKYKVEAVDKDGNLFFSIS